MEGRSRMVAALLAVWAVSACSGAFLSVHEGRPLADGVTILARIDGWRSELTSDPDGTRQVPDLLLEISYDEATARAAWADNVPGDVPAGSGDPGEFGIHADLDDVDFSQDAVVVYSAGQSGSCPAWLVDATYAAGAFDVVESDEVPEGSDGCSDVRVPYRLVLAVDRDKLPPPEDLPVDRVHVDGQDIDGLVTEYRRTD